MKMAESPVTVHTHTHTHTIPIQNGYDVRNTFIHHGIRLLDYIDTFTKEREYKRK